MNTVLSSFRTKLGMMEICVGEWRCGMRRRGIATSVNMHANPSTSVTLLPDASLLRLSCLRVAVFVDILRETDIRNTRAFIAHQMHIGIEQCRVYLVFARCRISNLRVVEVKLVEVHSFN
jgi:hypothetical protein